jgi:CHAT domain-containing protein
MSLSALRSLAMAAAEGGELQQADEELTALIDRLELEILPGSSVPDAARLQPDTHRLAEQCQCLLNRATVRSWAVRPTEALQDLEQAEKLAEQLKPLSRGSLLVGVYESRARLLAAPYSPKHAPADAVAAASKLRATAGSFGMAWVADSVDIDLARHRGDWHAVAHRAPALIAQLERLGQPRGVQALRLWQARAWLALGQPDQALAPAVSAHAFFAPEGPPDTAANAALALACARGRPHDWHLAEAALSQIEQLTRAQRSLFDQQRYLVEKLRLYDEAITLALGHAAEADASVCSQSTAQRQEAIERAWQVAERAKSFSLRQAMTQGGWLRAVDPDCAAALQALDARLDALDAQGPEAAAGQHDLRVGLAAERQKLLQAAMQGKPPLGATQAVPGWDLSATLQALPPGVGAVSWYWLKTPEGWQLNIFHAGADHVARLHQTSWSCDEIEAINQARLAHSKSRPFAVQQLLPSEHGDRLLPPAVHEALVGCHTLLLTPHRHLRQLPLHAMQVSDFERDGTFGASSDISPSRYLFERFAVQVLPSLALPFPAEPAERVGASPARQVLLMGCAQDAFRSPELEDVPSELAALAQSWAAAGQRVQTHELGVDALLPAGASLGQWPTFDVIHLACHGRFDEASPFDAALYLGAEALRARDFFDLQLRAEVVCLSACDVGQHSDRLDGLALVSDEWLGLAMPIFQAGARALLTSLWRADSKKTREFMGVFHSALAAGDSPARAHQQACLAMLHNRVRFGLWAGWQLAGFPGRSFPSSLSNPITSEPDHEQPL